MSSNKNAAIALLYESSNPNPLDHYSFDALLTAAATLCEPAGLDDAPGRAVTLATELYREVKRELGKPGEPEPPPEPEPGGGWKRLGQGDWRILREENETAYRHGTWWATAKEPVLRLRFDVDTTREVKKIVVAYSFDAREAPFTVGVLGYGIYQIMPEERQADGSRWERRLGNAQLHAFAMGDTWEISGNTNAVKPTRRVDTPAQGLLSAQWTPGKLRLRTTKGTLALESVQELPADGRLVLSIGHGKSTEPRSFGEWGDITHSSIYVTVSYGP
jgi:hypothetical protein